MTARQWTRRLEGAACGPFEKIVVVDEAASTQDTARRLDAPPGPGLAEAGAPAGEARRDARRGGAGARRRRPPPPPRSG